MKQQIVELDATKWKITGVNEARPLIHALLSRCAGALRPAPTGHRSVAR